VVLGSSKDVSDESPAQHLVTKYVFIDTEAFRKEGFDWTGKTLSRLVEFAKQDASSRRR
jgi:hypothetical protein